MKNEPPFIIVDGLKIAPILRIPERVAVPLDSAERELPPYGVVDRVTISRAARQKYAQSRSAALRPSCALGSDAGRLGAATYDASARLSIHQT